MKSKSSASEPNRITSRLPRNFSESFRTALKSYSDQQIASMQSSMEAIVKSIQPDLNSLIAPFEEFISRTEKELEQTALEISEPLYNAGFWIPPSSSQTMIKEIRISVSQGRSNPNQIRDIFKETYRSNDYEFLRSIVESCSKHGLFRDRIIIINAALRSHMNGDFVLSIPVLLPVIEGALIVHVGRRLTGGEGGISAMVKQAAQDAYMELMRAATSDALVEYVTGVGVYGFVDPDYFHPDRYPNWLKSKGMDPLQVLNRHAILHGVQYEYASEENSLRAFLLLDALSLIRRFNSQVQL